ncbi:MAG: hypothetical protein AABW73_00015 [Nanoarchaeota archaeon]
MKKVVYSLIAIIIILFSLIIILFNKGFVVGNSPPDWSSCKVLQNNGDDKISVVFLSSEANAKKFSDYLFSVEPYKSHREYFNIFYVDSPITCEIYNGVAVLCYSRDNVKLASVCPNDYIIAVKDGYDKSVRSSTYMNFVTLNSAHQPLVVSHEFSHALANLADEYVPASIPKGSYNCVSSCQDFSGLVCYPGCSKSDHFRSVDYGIMRSLTASDFGDFDSQTIISSISDQLFKISNGRVSLTTHAVSDSLSPDCSSQKYYLFDGHYDDNGVMVIDGKSLESGCVGGSGFGYYDYSLFLDDGELYSDGSFNPEFIIAESQDSGDSQIVGDYFVSDKQFYLKVPVVDNSRSLVISSGEEVVSQVYLNDDYSRFCKI